MKQFKYKLGQEEICIETGKMARQANGSVFIRQGGTAVLTTVCCGSESDEVLDYVPLSVDYNERYYAAGKIPGGFFKREARPKDKEILVSRLIDRPIRPLLYKEFSRDIQLIPMTVSGDRIHPPDTLGMLGAFAAVMISDIPFNGPVAAVRVARHKEKGLLINPTFEEMEHCILDIIVASNNDGICMIEGGGQEISEDEMLEAIEYAEVELKKLCAFLQSIADECGKGKLPLPQVPSFPEEKKEAVRQATLPLLEEVSFLPGKKERGRGVKDVLQKVKEQFRDQCSEEEQELLSKVLGDIHKEFIRSSILEKDRRCDNRNSSEIRPIHCEKDLLPQAHGSSLFTRGETQSLGIVTLGSVSDEQIIDDIDGDRREHFMLHYNFPPYSVGETGRLSTGRREIGHGHLAQRAIEPVLPPRDKYPYTIRMVSEILESNGSSSQATICSSSMALMAAGVPVRASVAGIAMGLIKEGEKFAVLSDILGEEDHLGDMDFKVAGSRKGVTSFQMDIKIPGIDIAIMKKALKQAHEGRIHILDIMDQTIREASSEVSRTAPKAVSFSIPVDKIGMLIGPSGKTIKGISEKTESKITVEESGLVSIFSPTHRGADLAVSTIKGMLEDPKERQVYRGVVRRLMDFGAFIEILPGKEGLCHISKISKDRIKHPSEILKVGQEVDVILLEIDRMRRLNLSMVDLPS